MKTKVTEKDLVGGLKGFPIEVVEEMLKKQVEQGNKEDIKVFQDDEQSSRETGGFSWCDTIEGYDFWKAVIIGKNFNKFSKRFPKKEDKKLTSILRASIAHDAISFAIEFVKDGRREIYREVEIPIVEFCDILSKLKYNKKLEEFEVRKHKPTYNKLEIFDGEWTQVKEYIK